MTDRNRYRTSEQNSRGAGPASPIKRRFGTRPSILKFGRETTSQDSRDSREQEAKKGAARRGGGRRLRTRDEHAQLPPRVHLAPPARGGARPGFPRHTNRAHAPSPFCCRPPGRERSRAVWPGAAERVCPLTSQAGTSAQQAALEGAPTRHWVTRHFLGLPMVGFRIPRIPRVELAFLGFLTGRHRRRSGFRRGFLGFPPSAAWRNPRNPAESDVASGTGLVHYF